jgi:hypothetical protein
MRYIEVIERQEVSIDQVPRQDVGNILRITPWFFQMVTPKSPLSAILGVQKNLHKELVKILLMLKYLSVTISCAWVRSWHGLCSNGVRALMG